MKKQIFTLLALLLTVCSGAWAQTYTDEAATVTWAFTSHESLTSTNVPADAFLTTNFSCGSNLNASSVTRNGKDNAWGQDYNMVAFKPTTTVAKNVGEKAENTLTFTITPATGITFTPENVSLIGCNYGGTGDPKTNIYVKYSDDTTESLARSITLVRDDKRATESGGASSPSILSYDLSSAVAGTFTVKIWMDALTNTAKGVAFTNIVITGKVSGSPVATTTYTITAATNDANLGTVTGTATVAENEEVTLTATPTAAGYFTKWQKDGVDFDGNTANPITVTATADATYTAIFEAKKVITFAKGEGTGTVPATDYVLSGADYVIPESYFLYKTGATLTGWNDGVNTYVPGATISNVTADIALTAVFTDNTVALGDAATTVNWTFDRSAGAPTIACENGELDYVQHTTISGTRFDAVMHVNTLKNAVIDGKTGKLNNTNSANNGQVNAATKFTIPVINGSVITYNGTSQTAATGDITFGGEKGSVSGAVTTYTYTGATGTLDIVDTRGGFYPSGISVTYPEPKTKYDAPTITVGDFSFENKGYVVTITKTDGDNLMVSTDGSSYTAQTSPYVTYATTTTHYYAKATGSSLDDSDVAEENLVNAFDGAKKYIAWVYESNYENKPKNYNIANDDIHTALGTVYNVVNVDIKDYKAAITDEQKAALNGNLDDADLVVISEAVGGASKGTIALKDLVGAVPMLSMKFFSYTSGRWDWGTPKNAGQAVVAITPASKVYKVLEGVTFSGDDVELFSYPNTQNHIQYVETWASEPVGDVLATTGSYPAMHASTSQKYFALGLSCDDFTKYNANAVAIVKNAAAMLIAGEDLDTEVSEVTIEPAKLYTTYVTPFALDFTGLELKAYVATTVATTASESKVMMESVTTVPAGTPLVLKKGDDASYDVPVIASADAPETNWLVASDGKSTIGGEGKWDYVLSNGMFYHASAGVLPAGKAYLHLDAEPGARELSLSFEDGDVTAISNVNRETITNNGYFNLAGQRVAQPTKGLYIVNGRKVVVK